MFRGNSNCYIAACALMSIQKGGAADDNDEGYEDPAYRQPTIRKILSQFFKGI